MHADELEIDADLVVGLVRSQFPELVGEGPPQEVRSSGTVNAVYRFGDGLCARLPRLARWSSDLEREQRWLPGLADRVTLDVPAPVRVGAPTADYPCPWAVYRWIKGEPYADDRVADEADAARVLAGFIAELRRVEVTGAPPAGRRPLDELDGETRSALGVASWAIDVPAALRAWERALRAPRWDETPVWIHGDLLRPNLLVRDGRLAAVIDFGGAGAGDPAMDVIAAWSVFGPPGRAVFREVLGIDAGTWERARGVALHQAAMIIPYYRDKHPDFVTLAVRTVEQVLRPG